MDQDSQQQLFAWLQDNVDVRPDNIIPIQGDASSRCYYRVLNQSIAAIAVDASQLKASNEKFVAIDKVWQALGLRVPKVFAQELGKGFLLIEDFGDNLFSSALTNENKSSLYEMALNALSKIQTCLQIPGHDWVNFAQDICLQDMHIWQQWYVEKYLDYTLSQNEVKQLQQLFILLQEKAKNQPQVCIHRDFHSRNLFDLENEVGIIDFQDAMWGPITYDLASLLRDCYVAWPQEDMMRLAKTFYKMISNRYSDYSEEEFLQDFVWMSLQRHLKALGTFARKAKRDNDESYLTAVPRTCQYILNNIKQLPELGETRQLLETLCINQQ